MFRIISSLLIPLSLLGLAVSLYPGLAELPKSQLVIVKLLPVLIAAISMGLCLRFNRSLVFFTSLVLVSSYILMQWYLPRLSNTEAEIIWTALCILLPLNIVVISILKERGVLTWWGSTRFALILIPLLIIVGVAKYYPVPLLGLLTGNFVEVEGLTQAGFAQLPLLIMTLAVLVLNGRWFANTSAQNSALFIALMSAIAMLYFKNMGATSAIFASAAMLMLLIAVIQESWSMAYIDQLTGLPGRRALEEELLKLGGNYSIAMMDIDHFKKFNDTHGHDAGDQVLQMVAARIRQAVSGGKAFRYGGEEFTIVFPSKKTKDALEPLEVVRKKIGDTKFQLRNNDRRHGKGKKSGGKNVVVTISIGVANRTERLATPNEVIKAADKALYKAKKQGRNKVCK
ncbi:GGDEF domain-containing protein [Pseudomonadota bacterium]